MKQDMIVILDLGSHENTVLARAIRALGVYSEIYPHDITVEELKALPNVKGIIINGGPNNVIDGVAIDVNPGIYSIGIPVMAAGHDKALCEVKLNEFSSDMEAIKESVKTFVFDTCKAEANWNMTNFVNDQIELVRRQVGDRKVLLALSGGVDSSVVAALLLKAIGDKLVCVHVNHGLMRKGESENVVEVFKNQLNANLIYKDVTDRFLDKLAGVADPEDQEDQESKDDLFPQLGDAPRFANRLDHLLHLCLSASSLDSLLGGCREGGSLDSDLLGDLAVAENLVTVLALGEDALGEERLGGDGLAVLKGVQRAEVDDLQGLGKDVVEAALGDAAGQRHLAAFEADADLAAGTGLLALVAAAAGLAVAAAGATALAIGLTDGALSGRQFTQFHDSVLLSFLP